MNQRDKIIRVIEILSDSLTSHLPYSVPFEYTERFIPFDDENIIGFYTPQPIVTGGAK